MTEPRTLRVTGAEIAARRYGGQVNRINMSPTSCVVCNHPTGACVSDDDATWVVENSTPDRTVTVLEDVWVHRPSPGAPNRPLTTLLAAAGTRKSLSELLRIEAHGYPVRYATDVESDTLLPRPSVLAQDADSAPDPEVVVDPQPAQVAVESVDPAEVVVESADPAEVVVESVDPAEESVDSAESDEDLPAAIRRP